MKGAQVSGATWVLVLIGLMLGGCSPSPLVGEWTGEDPTGKRFVIRILSDGTGDATQKGQPTMPLEWKPTKVGFELKFEDSELIGTLREDGKLALRKPKNPGLGILVLEKSTSDR